MDIADSPVNAAWYAQHPDRSRTGMEKMVDFEQKKPVNSLDTSRIANADITRVSGK